MESAFHQIFEFPFNIPIPTPAPVWGGPADCIGGPVDWPPIGLQQAMMLMAMMPFVILMAIFGSFI